MDFDTHNADCMSAHNIMGKKCLGYKHFKVQLKWKQRRSRTVYSSQNAAFAFRRAFGFLNTRLMRALWLPQYCRGYKNAFELCKGLELACTNKVHKSVCNFFFFSVRCLKFPDSCQLRFGAINEYISLKIMPLTIK